MADHSNFVPSSGSYDDLLKRMTQRVQQHKVDDQIVEILQQVFEKEFNKESMALSRPDRVRLFQQISKAILSDVLGKIGDPE